MHKGKPMCKTSVTRKPLCSTAIHDTLSVCVAFAQGAHSGAGSSAGVEDAWASLNTAVESTLVSIQSLVKEGDAPYWGFVVPQAPTAEGVPATGPALKAAAAAADGAAAEGDTAMGDGSDEDEDEMGVINVAAESGVCMCACVCVWGGGGYCIVLLSFGVAPSLARRFQLASACALPSSRCPCASPVSARRTLRAVGLSTVVRRIVGVLRACDSGDAAIQQHASDLRSLLEPLQSLCLRLLGDAVVFHRVSWSHIVGLRPQCGWAQWRLLLCRRVPCRTVHESPAHSMRAVLLGSASNLTLVFLALWPGHCEAAVRPHPGVRARVQGGFLPSPGGRRGAGWGRGRHRLPGRR